jgi:hypothetical protein
VSVGVGVGVGVCELTRFTDLVGDICETGEEAEAQSMYEGGRAMGNHSLPRLAFLNLFSAGFAAGGGRPCARKATGCLASYLLLLLVVVETDATPEGKNRQLRSNVQ